MLRLTRSMFAEIDKEQLEQGVATMLKVATELFLLINSRGEEMDIQLDYGD